MSSDMMMTFLLSCTDEQRLSFRVVSQCAPVLKGVKASNLIRIQAGSCKKVCDYLRGTHVTCIKLCDADDKEMLLLYREKQLRNHLQKQEIQDFLRQCGYENLSLAAVVQKLREHYLAYLSQKGDFPHELGVLLEYPIEDVRGFIEHQGQDYLMQRYWKVYENCDRARRLFHLFDEAKEEAMNEIVSGRLLAEVAVA